MKPTPPHHMKGYNRHKWWEGYCTARNATLKDFKFNFRYAVKSYRPKLSREAWEAFKSGCRDGWRESANRPVLTPYTRPAYLRPPEPYSSWLRLMEIGMSPDAYLRSTPIEKTPEGRFAFGFGHKCLTRQGAEGGRKLGRSMALLALRDNPIDWC